MLQCGFKSHFIAPSLFHTEQLGKSFMDAKTFQVIGHGVVVHQNGMWGVSLLGHDYQSKTLQTGYYFAQENK